MFRRFGEASTGCDRRDHRKMVVTDGTLAFLGGFNIGDEYSGLAEEILIATPYFIPGPRMIHSLLRAARRGVKVRLLLPGRSHRRFMNGAG